MFKFFSKKKSAPQDIAPVSHQAEYPEAVSLAARHSEEQRAPFLWLEDPSIPAPTQEELDAMESVEAISRRHEEELVAAIGPLSDLGAARFRMVYSQECAKHSNASTERMKARMSPEHIQEMDNRRSDAERIFTEFLEGHRLAPEFMETIEHGIAAGKRMASAPQEEQGAIAKEIGREIANRYVEGGGSDINALHREVHGLAMKKGMDEVYAKKDFNLPSLTPNPPPEPQTSRLPFLEGAPFYATRLEKVTFIAGRLGQGTGHLLADGKILIPSGEFMFSPNAIKAVELATQERVTKWSSALGWTVVGGSLLGPAGAIVGGLLGGQKDDMTYLVTFSEEHRCLVSSSARVYHKLLGATI